ncbi:MAG: hypothetical protein KGJ06_07165 [Pseudomonadota bacterium]|nr:hypothetical protein [Pseudomonadota bacterium]
MNTFSGLAGVTLSGIATPRMAPICNACSSQVAAASMPQTITPDQTTSATLPDSGRNYTA